MFTSSYFVADLGFASEDELEKYVRTNEDIFGAIVFGKSDWNILPKNISYKIRLRSYKRTSGSDKSERIEWKTNVMTDAADRRKPGPRNDIGPGRFFHKRKLIIYFCIYLTSNETFT